MASNKIHVIKYKRRRSQKTDYRKRLRLLLSGKNRLVLRFSGNSITAQIIEYQAQGDIIKVGVNSSSLSVHGWNYTKKNLPASYLTGLLLAKKAKEAGYKGELVLDIGLQTIKKQGRIFAVLKGALDGGLSIKYGGDSIFPNAEALQGKRIADYAGKLQAGEKALYEKHFSKYVRDGVDPSKMPEVFLKVKGVLLG